LTRNLISICIAAPIRDTCQLCIRFFFFCIYFFSRRIELKKIHIFTLDTQTPHLAYDEYSIRRHTRAIRPETYNYRATEYTRSQRWGIPHKRFFLPTWVYTSIEVLCMERLIAFVCIEHIPSETRDRHPFFFPSSLLSISFYPLANGVCFSYAAVSCCSAATDHISYRESERTE